MLLHYKGDEKERLKRERGPQTFPKNSDGVDVTLTFVRRQNVPQPGSFALSTRSCTSFDCIRTNHRLQPNKSEDGDAARCVCGFVEGCRCCRGHRQSVRDMRLWRPNELCRV